MIRLLPHGEINNSFQDGSVMLRNLLIIFVVIICFAVVCVSMASVSRNNSRFLQRVNAEIDSRNDYSIKRLNQ